MGRVVAERQRLDVETLRRYAVALGSDPEVERAPPPLAHWAFFLPLAEDGELGTDGHPRRGGFLPAVSLPRRMFAGATIDFLGALALGEEAELVSRIIDVEAKTGASGELVFVEVERALIQAGAARVRERQTYVYRDAGAPTPLPQPIDPAPAGEIWRPGTVNLFRFSAATFNSHRIHFDLPYAGDVEGYPALVVHGPFTAARLAGIAERGGSLARFRFRALAPLFLGQPIALREREGELAAIRCDGVTAMIAEASQG